MFWQTSWLQIDEERMCRPLWRWADQQSPSGCIRIWCCEVHDGLTTLNKCRRICSALWWVLDSNHDPIKNRQCPDQTIQGRRTLLYPYQHIILGKGSSCCSPPLRILTLWSDRPCWAKGMTQSVKNSGHCIGNSLGAQSMMRACTRPNLGVADPSAGSHTSESCAGVSVMLWRRWEIYELQE